MKFTDIKQRLDEVTDGDKFKYAKVSIGSSAKGESVYFFDQDSHTQFHEEYMKLVQKYNDIFETRVEKAKKHTPPRAKANESLDEEIQGGENGYICFYKGEKIEVFADTTREAQKYALSILQKKYPRKKIKEYEITPKLAELKGNVHYNSTLDF
jgi:hypothetical protein